MDFGIGAHSGPTKQREHRSQTSVNSLANVY